jgi:hypothetical protein
MMKMETLCVRKQDKTNGNWKVDRWWLEDRWRRPPNTTWTRRGNFGGSRDTPNHGQIWYSCIAQWIHFNLYTLINQHKTNSIVCSLQSNPKGGGYTCFQREIEYLTLTNDKEDFRHRWIKCHCIHYSLSEDIVAEEKCSLSPSSLVYRHSNGSIWLRMLHSCNALFT